MNISYPAMALSTMSGRQSRELWSLLKSSRACKILGSSSMSTCPSPSQSWSLDQDNRQSQDVKERNQLYLNIHLSWPERVPRVARFSVASITFNTISLSHGTNFGLTSLKPRNEDQLPSFFVSWNNLNILSIFFLMLMSSLGRNKVWRQDFLSIYLNSSSIWGASLSSNFVRTISTYCKKKSEIYIFLLSTNTDLLYNTLVELFFSDIHGGIFLLELKILLMDGSFTESSLLHDNNYWSFYLARGSKTSLTILRRSGGQPREGGDNFTFSFLSIFFSFLEISHFYSISKSRRKGYFFTLCDRCVVGAAACEIIPSTINARLWETHRDFMQYKQYKSILTISSHNWTERYNKAKKDHQTNN